MSGLSSPIRYPINLRLLSMSYLSYQLITRTMERTKRSTWEPGPGPFGKDKARNPSHASVGGGHEKRGPDIARSCGSLNVLTRLGVSGMIEAPA